MTRPLDILHEESPQPGSRELPDGALTHFYGGRLLLPESFPAAVIANFVTTIDGVTTLDRSDARGAAGVSAGSVADRTLMAILRAAADVILIGAGTFRVTAGHRWTAPALMPELTEELDAARLEMTGSASPPRLVVVSASGRVPMDHRALSTPGLEAMVVTTEAGVRQLGPPPAGVRIAVAARGAGGIAPPELMTVIQREMSPRLVLTEGGPLLFGALLFAGLVTELFHTVTPIIAGRTSAAERPGLADGHQDTGAGPRGTTLLSLRRGGDGVLFFRHRITASSQFQDSDRMRQR